MSADIKDIIDNIKEISVSDSSLEFLLNFERVLDEVDLYVFKNWKNGEIVEGPKVDKYWITCTLMWPRKLMPDPRGGERLLGYGCEVSYRKSFLLGPKEVESYDDFNDGTKFPRTKKYPIWLVEIVMPRQLMDDIQRGSLEIEGEELDMEEVDSAYDEADDNGKTSDDSENNKQSAGGQPNA